MRATFVGALREPNFAKYFTAATVSTTGTYAGDIALTFGILGIWGPGTLALTLLFREIAVLVFLLIGGVIADRYPRHLVIAVSALTQACSQAAVGAILLTASGGAIALMCLAALNGAAIAVARPARSGLLPLVVSKELLQEANALLGLTPPVLGIIGLSLGAGLTVLIEPGWALIFDAVTFVISAAFFLVLRVQPAPVGHVSHTGAWSSAKEGWREVRSRQWLWVTIAVFAVIGFTYFPSLYVLGSSIAEENYGGATAWAVILMTHLVGGVLGGLLAGRMPLPRPLIVVGLGGGVLSLELFAFALRLPMLVVVPLALLSGLGITLANVAWATTLQRLIPSHVLGRVSSFDWLGSLALAPIGYALVGPLASVAGQQGALAAFGAFISAACLGVLLVPSTRRLTFDDNEDSATSPSGQTETEESTSTRPRSTTIQLRTCRSHC